MRTSSNRTFIRKMREKKRSICNYIQRQTSFQRVSATFFYKLVDNILIVRVWLFFCHILLNFSFYYIFFKTFLLVVGWTKMRLSEEITLPLNISQAALRKESDFGNDQSSEMDIIIDKLEESE